MKRILVIISLNVMCLSTIHSQILAGSDSSGLIISNPNVNLSNSTMISTVSSVFDLDCDSVSDIRIDLHKGATAIDGSNNAYLNILNPAIEICSDTSLLGMYMPRYYNINDTLYCNANSTWHTDTIYGLGNYGCMDCPGPFSKTNAYIAYKNNITSQIGWFKISFNLNDGGGGSVPVTLSINEVLSPCTVTTINTNNALAGTELCGVFSFDYLITPPTCNGWCDGSIAISNVQGGTPGYSFIWDIGFLGSNCTNVCSGTYQLTISDASGYSCTSAYVVPNSEPLTFSLTITGVSCNGGNDGSVCCANISGGSSPYSFSWAPSASSGQCANNLPSGNYSVCVTDAQGCIVCEQVNVNEPYLIQAYEVLTPATCPSCCDGSAQLNVTGGTAPYSYFWMTTGEIGFGINNLCPGVYSYCIQDAQGCTICDTLTISNSVSLQDISVNNTFTISPNPASDVLNIELPSQNNNTQIEIENTLGQKVYETKANNNLNTIDLKHLESGVYLIKIYTAGQLVGTEKFIKE